MKLLVVQVKRVIADGAGGITIISVQCSYTFALTKIFNKIRLLQHVQHIAFFYGKSTMAKSDPNFHITWHSNFVFLIFKNHLVQSETFPLRS